MDGGRVCGGCKKASRFFGKVTHFPYTPMADRKLFPRRNKFPRLQSLIQEETGGFSATRSV